MGDYDLHLDDCLEIMPTLAKGNVAMVFADLPYTTQSRKCTHNVWDQPFDLDELWRTMMSLSSATTVFVFTGTQPFVCDLIASNPTFFKYDLIFQKSSATGFFNSNRQPLRAHEHILLFYQKAGTYNPQFKRGAKPYAAAERKGSSLNYGNYYLNFRKENDGTRHPVSVLPVQSEGRRHSLHPTQKPVALLEWLIATYTNPGDTVLDPVMGSGTTGVACANLGRRFVGIEKDPTYFAAARARIEAAYAEAAAPKQKAMAL